MPEEQDKPEVEPEAEEQTVAAPETESQPESVPETESQPEVGTTSETAESGEQDQEQQIASTEEEGAPVATEEQDETGIEDTEEEVPEATEEQTEKKPSKISVSVRASLRGENLMHLKAIVNGPEDSEYDYQWQVSVDGGESYEDMEDQNEDWMDIELDEENVNNLWRVRVHTI